MERMNLLGNILWLIFGGFISAISWCLAGVLWCITFVGIPIGLQCFKFASLSISPFGKNVQYGGGFGSMILNIFWLILSGIPLALEHLAMGIFLCITIVGIPFGLQHFKIAKLALLPFGAKVCWPNSVICNRGLLHTTTRASMVFRWSWASKISWMPTPCFMRGGRIWSSIRNIRKDSKQIHLFWVF